MEDSPRKSNLSFSFNLDLDSVDSDATSDSDAAGLQIDVSEVESFNGANTFRRQVVDDTSFINEMEEELERQLDAKAAKTNLTATNVKNILKHVISNEHVMAMVHKRLTKGDEDIVFEPKLTRAKAKELAMAQPDIPWPMTPVKNTNSEVQILIQEEFPEDSSDEEYDPNQDQQSDDEKDVDNSVGSDIDSQPRTPATPNDSSVVTETPCTPNVHYDEEGIFKVPQNIPHVLTEEESIGHRTRSKLCLSETPLEQIEQAFIPPDITTDMYDWDWEPEDEYINFLKELYTQPLPKEVNIDDDPEADPEYNILEDEETELLDKEEELREDRAVKVTKKELNTLIAELDEFADQYARQHEQEQEQLHQQHQHHQHQHQHQPQPQQQPQQHQQQLQQKQKQQCQQQQQHFLSPLLPQQKLPKKKRSFDNSFTSTESMSPQGNHMVDLLPVLAQPELPQLVSSNQCTLLAIQITQHIQLMVQQFLMTYKHPKYHQYSKICKSNLNSLCTLGGTSNSQFKAQNLSDALKLVSDWELKLEDSEFTEEYTNFLETEAEYESEAFHTKRKYETRFHPELIKLMAESKALMYPQLLPDIFSSSLPTTYSKYPYSESEESLIAIGLEQFIPYFKSFKKKFSTENNILADALKEIQKYLLPIRDSLSLIHHVKKRRISKQSNPIKFYYNTGSTPPVIHQIVTNYNQLPPNKQPAKSLSLTWQKLLTNLRDGTIDEFIMSHPKNRKRKRKSGSVSDSNDAEYYEYLSVPHIEITVHEDHELRNPIVNMLHMPSLMTPHKDDPGNSTSRNSSAKTKAPQSKPSEPESDAESAESLRTCETDEEESRPTRLRMTTPRLAKIKSAQNMKMMAQTLSPKSSTSSNSINESKDYSFDKNDDDASSSFTKGDDEDEIAELMLASTTIKKNTASRKKTKQARELENLKRLLEAEININEDERSTKFAASFIQKIHVKLESKDPELFKTVLKMFVNYSEKIESASESSTEDFLSETASSSDANCKNIQVTERKDVDRDKLSVDLYKEVCEKLHEYPDLCSDFLLFLTPHQAALIDKSVEHTMMMKMKEFVNVTQMYFAKQPSRIAKVMQAMTQMASDPYVTLESAQNIMGSALKGHPLIMDMFLQVLPTGKPPDSLFAAHMFENLSCPVGPHDKNKEYDPDAPELYENIELPVSTPQEDPYGGESCKCDCHSLVDDSKLKGMNEHCASCGTRFLNGRIYLQTSEGLRPAKITFPGADDEKLENISRVSLKTTERIIPNQPPRKRRKSSKRDSISEEAKTCTSKSSPTKENEESDKAAKAKKGIKSPPKSAEQKKINKIQSTAVKCKREKKTEKKDGRLEQKTDDDQNDSINIEQAEFDEGVGNTTSEEYTEADLFGSKLGEISTDSHEDESMTSPEKPNASISIDKLDVSSDSDSSTNAETESPLSVPWTMQEDKILIENVQKEYSEKMFQTISLLLKNRTVEQVKERCEYLLSLIEKMA